MEAIYAEQGQIRPLSSIYTDLHMARLHKLEKSTWYSFKEISSIIFKLFMVYRWLLSYAFPILFSSDAHITTPRCSLPLLKNYKMSPH